jgi:hypothetical protein
MDWQSFGFDFDVVGSDTQVEDEEWEILIRSAIGTLRCSQDFN